MTAPLAGKNKTASDDRGLCPGPREAFVLILGVAPWVPPRGFQPLLRRSKQGSGQCEAACRQPD